MLLSTVSSNPILPVRSDRAATRKSGALYFYRDTEEPEQKLCKIMHDARWELFSILSSNCLRD